MRIRYGVLCSRHGVESKDWAGKQVIVSQPQTKNERKNGGCPHCNREAYEAAKAALEGVTT